MTNLLFPLEPLHSNRPKTGRCHYRSPCYYFHCPSVARGQKTIGPSPLSQNHPLFRTPKGHCPIRHTLSHFPDIQDHILSPRGLSSTQNSFALQRNSGVAIM